ncbi:MAG: ATP-binding cassette domain-containing protein [Bacilli bacterium]|nr:ATP-binding cassette domain-containing protein [Bacilli bacterium]
MKNILQIKNLSKIYHDKYDETLAIDNISFDVKEHEIISIVGPSGCGKSTLLSIMAGLTNKSNGNIIMNNNIKIGYMLQTDSLFPWRTILDNCLIGLELNNELTDQNINNVKKLLEKYGLKDFIYKYPDNLSGGMRQRVVCML